LKHDSTKNNKRALLINWLIGQTQKFNCKPETLYLTVLYLDKLLAKRPLLMQSLQIVGLAALFTASKVMDIYSVKMTKILTMAKNVYKSKEILDMESSLI